MVKPINYEFNSDVLYPFNFGVQHLKNGFSTQVVWRERIVHLAWGILEMVPIINYVIAIADRILHPAWIWDLANFKIKNIQSLPLIDQSDIDCRIAKITIPFPTRQMTAKKPNISQGLFHFYPFPYSWYEIFSKQDTDSSHHGANRLRNSTVINRAHARTMRGLDHNGDPFLVFSQPTLRKSYPTTFSNIPLNISHSGNEVNMIFKDGSCITLFTSSNDIESYISRMPEESPGLMDILR